MQETWVWYLGREDPLEKEKATYSSILAWRILWTRSLEAYGPCGRKESDTAKHSTEAGYRSLFFWGKDVLVICVSLTPYMVFPCGSGVKNLSEIQDMQVQSLGQEDPLEKGMAAHSSILAWEIPWTEESGGP